MTHKVLCFVLFLAVCSSYVKATSTSCDLKLARIVSNSALLNVSDGNRDIVIDQGETITFSCRSACGSIEYMPLIGSYTEISHHMSLCKNGSCENLNYLNCNNAADGTYVHNIITLIPHSSRLQLQCTARLQFSPSVFFNVNSKAVLITVRTETVSTSYMPSISPSSSYLINCPSPTLSITLSSLYQEPSTTPMLSKRQETSSCSCSPTNIVEQPTVNTVTSFLNSTVCVKAQDFTYSAVGIGIVFLIIGLSGWVMCCVCVKLRHKKSRKGIVQPIIMTDCELQSSLKTDNLSSNV